MFDKIGNQPVEMDVDNMKFPLESITNYDSYMDLKQPKREVKITDIKLEVVLSSETTLRVYTKPRATVQETMESLISQFGRLESFKDYSL